MLPFTGSIDCRSFSLTINMLKGGNICFPLYFRRVIITPAQPQPSP